MYIPFSACIKLQQSSEQNNGVICRALIGREKKEIMKWKKVWNFIGLWFSEETK